LEEVGYHFELIDVDVELMVHEARMAKNVGRPGKGAPEPVGVGDEAAPTCGGGITVAGTVWVSGDKVADTDRPRVWRDRKVVAYKL
jgi:hypothetical protein